MGKKFFLESKGRFIARDRKKHLLIKEQNPKLDIRFLFMQDQVLYKGSDTTYSQWCDKYNFKYAFKTVPKEWLN